jgi:hypothetical protein
VAQRNVNSSTRDALRVKSQQPTRTEPAATLQHATGSTWRGDVAEDMAAFTAAVATPCPHSHSLPSRTVAEVLSCPDANRWHLAIDEDFGSCQAFGVWKEVHLPKEKLALPSFFIFAIKRDGRYKAGLVAGEH